MKHKLLRALVAVLLVCVLVVNVSPIRARASALPEVAGVVTKVIPFNPGSAAAAGGAALGTQVFCWVLFGLGIVATTAVAVDLMNRYVEFSGELETTIYYYPDGSWSYGVDMGFVERVRAFLFDTGVLVSNAPVYLSEFTYSGQTWLFSTPVTLVCYYAYEPAGAQYTGLIKQLYAVSAQEFTYTKSGYSNVYTSFPQGSVHVRQLLSSSGGYLDFGPNVTCISLGSFDNGSDAVSALNSQIVTLPDLQIESVDGIDLGTVAP